MTDKWSLMQFFALAFGISWLFWLPGVMSGFGVLTFPVDLTPLAVFGPSLAAFWLTFRGEGWAGVKRLLRRALDWRIPAQWLLVTILLPIIIAGLTVLVFQISEGASSSAVWRIPDFLPHPLLIVPYFIFTFIFQGPVGEEFGWRGYALERLLAKWSSLISSVILGALWGVWHLPLFFLPGGPHAESIPLLPFIFSTIPLSVLITWIYNHTGRNLLTALLFHQFVNFSLELNPAILHSSQAFTVFIALITVAAIPAAVALQINRYLWRSE